MTQQGTDVSWALRDLAESIQEIRFALVASSDGKAITSYGADDPDDVDRFAAVVAGLQALAQPVAEQFPKYAGQLRLGDDRGRRRPPLRRAGRHGDVSRRAGQGGARPGPARATR